MALSFVVSHGLVLSGLVFVFVLMYVLVIVPALVMLLVIVFVSVCRAMPWNVVVHVMHVMHAVCVFINID